MADTPSPTSSRLRSFWNGLRRVRFHHFGGGRFDLLLTRWFYITNHAYSGERIVWVRVGQWRKSLGWRRA